MKILPKQRGLSILTALCFVLTLGMSGVRQFVVQADGTPVLTGTALVTELIGEPVSLAQVQISGEDGGDVVPMRLSVSHGDLVFGDSTGLTFDSDPSGGQLSFSGTVDDINAALATLTYTRYELGTDTLDVSLTSADQVYNPANGHLYEYVYSDEYDPESEESTGINWADAKVQADGMHRDGLTGYLTTITSAEENDYVAAKLPDAGWMGASDSAVEGEWRWVDGPESGTQFWQGGTSGDGGHAVNDEYNAWNNGNEPNDSGGPDENGDSGEDCAQYLSGSDGLWNDLPCHNSLLPGFVVEFGDDTHQVNVTHESVSITTVGPTVNVATCGELQTAGTDNQEDNQYATINLTADIDCTGIDFEPLFSSYGFAGTFDGHGHTISHLTIDRPDNGDVGLFSMVYKAVIQDFTLSGGSVSGEYNVGAVAGEAEASVFTDIASDLNVTGTYDVVGGLIGYYGMDGEDNSDTVVNSGLSSTGAVSGIGYTGGLIGRIEVYDGADVTLEHSFATGSVTYTGNEDEDYAFGGLVGEAKAYVDDGGNATLAIQDTYATGAVSFSSDDYGGASSVGGLIGAVVASNGTSSDLAKVIVQRSYASGAVTGHAEIGGLAGTTWANSGSEGGAGIDVQHNFAVGHLTADPELRLGGVFGYVASDGNDDSTFLDNYYDITRTGTMYCDGMASLETCGGVNADGSQADYYKNNHSHAPLNVWNFSGVWIQHASAYPTFGNLNDNDGITPDTENAAPNSGDANDDGVPDSEQANVASVLNEQTGKYITVAAPDSCNLSAVTTTAETANAKLDSGYVYPTGLVNYTADCGTPGYVATITLYVYGAPLSNPALRKYNPATKTYDTIAGAIIEPVTVGGQQATRVSYQITDGSALDMDGDANGVIVDPVGLAETAGALANTGVNLLTIMAGSATILCVAVMVRRGRTEFRKPANVK